MDKKHHLHTGIKDIIQANGVEPIRTVQLANILADYSAYDEYPATKVILKDVLTNGLGQRIYDAFKKSGNSSLAEIEKIKQDYSRYLEFNIWRNQNANRRGRNLHLSVYRFFR